MGVMRAVQQVLFAGSDVARDDAKIAGCSAKDAPELPQGGAPGSIPGRSTIITRYEPPPIPLRQFDWCAVRDSYDGGDPAGYGATEQEAIDDLLAEEEMREEEAKAERVANSQFGVGA